jgi:putative exosortase-associated protein (TIGR04073 family)
MEIPPQVVRKTDPYRRKAGWSYGAVDGTQRFLKRLGYGFYELFSFAVPPYRGTYKPPYQRCGEDNRIEMNPHDGLSEFPPELGFETYFTHSRTQTW